MQVAHVVECMRMFKTLPPVSGSEKQLPIMQASTRLVGFGTHVG